MNDGLLLAIKPRFADAILSGEKTVELRRVRPQVEPGAKVVLYASSPVKAVVGTFTVDRVVEASPRALWPQVRGLAAVTRREFYDYFDGASTAVAIFLKAPASAKRHLSLEQMRRASPAFSPPQGYQYLAGLCKRVQSLLISTL